jgi:plasmid stability protein
MLKMRIIALLLAFCTKIVYNYMQNGGNMHALQIRNLPDELYEKLKKQAKSHHRSLAGEALYVLEQHLHGSSFSRDDLFDEIAGVREEIEQKYGATHSSVSLIREDRQR